MTQKLVIIGGGHAAAQCIVTLKQKKFEGRVTLISDEPELPYQRPPLSKTYIMGELTKDRLPILRQTAYEALGVDLRLNIKATKVDTAKRQIDLADGSCVEYDKLIIATGGHARRLAVPGSWLEGIFSIRTIADIDNMQSHFNAAKRIIIVGGGYIGLEAASAARKAGKQVTILEMADRLLARVVAPEVSQFYQNLHESEGITVITGAAVDGYLADTDDVTGGQDPLKLDLNRVKSVQLTDGRRFDTDMVIEGVGMVPNSALAEMAGLEVSALGIVVDQYCRTSDPLIFAVGDVTDHENSFLGYRTRLESVQNAVDQAKIAIENALGGANIYRALPWFWSEQYGLKLQIAGLAQQYDQVCVLGDVNQRKVTFLYLKGRRLIAADCIDNTSDFISAKKLILAGIDLPLPFQKEDTLKSIAARLLGS